MEKGSKIYISGHTGLLGSALEKHLRAYDFKNLILRSSKELDLRDQLSVKKFFYREKPEYVFHAAAKVGGLHANNTKRADFILDNLKMQTNVLETAWKSGVQKLLFYGSNCIYPRECSQPMQERDIMTGKFEPTNEPYAIAKIAGIGTCQALNSQYKTNFITAIPASMYGPNDNFEIDAGHIIPTLIRKCHEAKINEIGELNIPGSPFRIREMIYVDDVADASLFLMNNYDSSDIINVGTYSIYNVKEIARFVKEVVGYNGEIIFDESKPSGMMAKVIDSSRLKSLGWHAKTNIVDGLKKTYEWFLESSI